MYSRGFDRKYLWIAVYGILGILAAVSLIQGCKNALTYSQDFQWDAAKALVLGINPYEESLQPTGILNSYGFEEYFSKMEANQFPSLLLLLFPFTLLPPMQARIVWLVCNLVFTLLIAFGLKKTFFKTVDHKLFGAVILLMISGTPWRNQIGVGQHTLFSMAFFLLAVWFAENKRQDDSKLLPQWAAVLLTVLCLVICYFKYTLTVPLVLYFVYKRYWKELFFSAGVHVLATIWAANWLHTGFLDMIIQPLKVSSALSGEGSIDISVILQGSPVAFVVSGILFLVLLFLVFSMPKGNDRLVISLLTLCSLIITYHRSYDFFVLIVPICFFVTDGLRVIEEKVNLFYFYCILVAAVFYGLRLFHEAPWSLLCVGILYYLFTMCIMVMCFLACANQWKQKKGLTHE